VLLILFAAGHTAGFLTFKPNTAQAAAVREAMDRVPLQSGHTYGGIYVGFGLYISALLLFSALLAWSLGGLTAKMAQALGGLAWGFFAMQLVSLALSYLYFGAPPAVFSALVALCVGGAAWLAPRQIHAPSSTREHAGRL
jgi:hypothetical protein